MYRALADHLPSYLSSTATHCNSAKGRHPLWSASLWIHLGLIFGWLSFTVHCGEWSDLYE